MGTYYVISYFAKSDNEMTSNDVDRHIKKDLAEVNRQMSTYQNDSEISQFNRAKKNTEFPISDDFARVLSFSIQLAKKTDGRFDPTIGPLVNLWGFGPSGDKKVPTKKEIQKAKSSVGFEKLKLAKKDKQWFLAKTNSQTYVDLSATAKGYAVDKISQFLRAQQLSNHIVDIGGELVSSGNKYGEKWSVAIETPSTTQKSIQKVIALKNQAIATSGSYRNFFTENGIRYNHTIDSKTGQSIQSDLVSVSVVDSRGLITDGLATALMTLGFDQAKIFAQKNSLKVYLIKYIAKENRFETFSSL